MMPVRLTMTAFGPYKDKEVIDFAELSGNRLFLVSGNTGAGKTSIFDAICFALYGEASGEDRSDVRMLRSQFASDDLYTSVAFEFELKRRTYRILRQLPHVKTGNKSATGEKYEFVETTGGEETMMVDRHAVRQINERMQTLLGLTKEQFGQIVMLPQGEFRKLLTSDTENKEEIMRRIFRTHLFKFVAEHLNEKRKASQSEWELSRRDLDMQAANLKLVLAQRENSALARVLGQEHFNVHQVIEALDEEMAHYEGEKAVRQARLEEDSRRHKALVDRYHAAARVNELYGEFDRKTSEKEGLESRIPEIEAKKRRLALAEKTLPLEVRERMRESARAQAKAAAELRQTAEAAAGRAAAELAAARERHAREEGRGERREALVRELERLSRDLPAVRELEERRAALGRLEREASASLREQQTAEAAAAARRETRKALTERARQAEETVRGLPELAERFERMLQEATLLREYVLLARAAAAQAEEEAGLRLAHEEAAKRYLALEAGWLEGQAGQLAAHLHDGKPCPVCGSEAHPRPAEPPADMPTREALDRLRADKGGSGRRATWRPRRSASTRKRSCGTRPARSNGAGATRSRPSGHTPSSSRAASGCGSRWTGSRRSKQSWTRFEASWRRRRPPWKPRRRTRSGLPPSRRSVGRRTPLRKRFLNRRWRACRRVIGRLRRCSGCCARRSRKRSALTRPGVWRRRSCGSQVSAMRRPRPIWTARSGSWPTRMPVKRRRSATSSRSSPGQASPRRPTIARPSCRSGT
ncbi:AAA family ATPase [Cohnella rhizosphaerae]|uniref:Nuclease SbcCD subunit C n=1 Tax=Cohnella rhizosphaerae TaxID=1457232 RepID=A0A9X4KW62_9BACL|nr:AAA family ATPase [Cohnella rhizosphaerae]MDG0812057.1 AAA family ATPase [Cohnella rhizosphaerae]